MTDKLTITFDQMEELRQNGTLTTNEIALIEGDIILAKNVVTQERRIIGKASDVINESSSKKRILKD